MLPGLAAAAVEGRAALGERAGQRDGRFGRDGRWEPLVKGPLCASLDGFSLHAGAWVWDREKLEKLCCYAARPAVGASGASAELVDTAVRAVVGGGARSSAEVSLQAELAESVRLALPARAPGARRKRRTGPRRRYPWAELLRRNARWKRG